MDTIRKIILLVLVMHAHAKRLMTSHTADERDKVVGSGLRSSHLFHVDLDGTTFGKSPTGNVLQNPAVNKITLRTGLGHALGPRPSLSRLTKLPLVRLPRHFASPQHTSIPSEVEAALQRWGSPSPKDDFASMCQKWPELLAADLEGDVRPRLAQFQHLVSDTVAPFSSRTVLPMDLCLQLVVQQPQSLGNYRVHTLWEDQGLVAVNKPWDMLIDYRNLSTNMTRNMTISKRIGPQFAGARTVGCWFRARYPGQRVRFCNQLDRGTSGIMLAASTEEAARRGGFFFSRKEANKTYLAIVVGHPSWKGEVHLVDRIALPRSGYTRRIAQADEPSEEAETVVRVRRLGTWPVPCQKSEAGVESRCLKAALIEVRLLTGRRHQIRLHLSAAGYPILGDDLYGGYGEDKGHHGAAYRMFLHAWRLEVPSQSLIRGQPETVVIEAPCSFDEELGLYRPGSKSGKETASSAAAVKDNQIVEVRSNYSGKNKMA
eukprot:gnl/TRDRNA2_/TRDRNA2_165852_c0_seq4.p1 gnl/TRDRNA2_/TRDRNA2_165852_c0~~gnl/TRDRNA2_/TRDRNA2_165852_c0_seq4.p1  ORF type:complete len:487 (+),score=50.42 gnl/TRDRNA2_/TRDRNA2_165852_c0_seq4:68-1528(+)